MILASVFLSMLGATLLWNLSSDVPSYQCYVTSNVDNAVYLRNGNKTELIKYLRKGVYFKGSNIDDMVYILHESYMMKLKDLKSVTCTELEEENHQLLVGDWGAWSSWSTCVEGKQSRGRICGGVSNSSLCDGKYEEVRKCISDNRRRFLVDDSYWGDWGEWSVCNVRHCDSPGVSSRTRHCLPSNQLGGCIGNATDFKICRLSTCGQPYDWTQWSPCTPCGTGQSSRSRNCSDAEIATCPGGSITETRNDCPPDLCIVDGHWSGWSDWSTCSQVNGVGGLVTRLRECNNPYPVNGGKDCDGQRYQFLPCSQVVGWSAWAAWSKCQHTQIFDVQIRKRTCVQDKTGNDCPGQDFQSQPCIPEGTLSQWSSWGPCDVTCGYGNQARYQSCFPSTDRGSCTHNTTETNRCYGGSACIGPNLTGWSEWSPWTLCSQPCQGSNSTRNRTCLGGPCAENSVEQKFCTEDLCIVDGGWTSWTEWSIECLTDVGGNYHYRKRSCSHPESKNGGTKCMGNTIDLQICKNESEWGSWSAWSDCILSRNNATGAVFGVTGRDRICHTGLYNDSCVGDVREYSHCNLTGNWELWTSWTTCSLTCGEGAQTRQRSCDLGPVQFCEGNANDTKACTLTPNCPIDGAFSQWSDWSACPVTCAGGVIYRNRACNNPTPKYGGKTCEGKTSQVDVCSIQDCPVDGHWADWSPWSTCSRTCGNGTKSRDRTCTNPAPKNTGKTCNGTSSATAGCIEQICSVDGGWGTWSDWSQCSCQKYHTRQRLCNNPTPLGAGAYCVGDATQNQTCDPDLSLACPVNGGWAQWLEWSSRCSVTCNEGTVSRFRTCTKPKPENGGAYCPGDYENTRECVEKPCPVDGEWSIWSAWAPCDVTCDNGTTFRTRSCSNPAPQFGGSNCSGVDRETTVCSERHCPIDGQWSSWGTWSSWDATCADATRSRSRTCDNPAPNYGGNFCAGERDGHENTKFVECPIDGGWSEWDSWTACSVTCEIGTKSRNRTCTNPIPQFNGAGCQGSGREVVECVDRPSCKINGLWSEWSPWFGCSTSCGDGLDTRYRACNKPPPQNGGLPCQGSFRDAKSCNLKHCPIDGGWAEWNAWEPCSVTCANGTASRSRSCSNPPPQFEGKQCEDNFTDSKECNDKPCPIDGAWSAWTEWYSCSVTCGDGFKIRNRTCSNPAPQYGGQDCLGSQVSNTNCSMVHCPVDGGWGAWLSWSTCSDTCGNGTRTRTRDCDSPAPDYHGADCVGSATDVGECFLENCAIDGGWSDWTPWSPCASSSRQRYRDCINPSPQFGGLYCTGDSSEIGNCTARR